MMQYIVKLHSVYLHFKTENEVVLPQQDVMSVISNNPAHNKLVTLHTLKEVGCTFSNTKDSFLDYENIEELYFKQK